MLLAYLDESGTHADSPVMGVAGSLYRPRDRRALDREWKRTLAAAGIPYFHAVEHAHLRGQFEGWNRAAADGVQRHLLGLLRKYSCGAAAVLTTVPDADFKEFEGVALGSGRYTTCAFFCMQLLLKIARWQDHTKVSFTLERGHADAAKLKGFLQTLTNHDNFRSPFFFAGKSDARPLQTADIWAYELVKHARELHLQSGRPVRKSLESIAVEGRGQRLLILTPSHLKWLGVRFFERMIVT
jgi:Protein of unknown function (DUF3800)